MLSIPRRAYIWCQSVIAIDTPLILEEDALCVLSKGAVIAFDKLTGRRRWRWRKGILGCSLILYPRSLASAGGRVFVANKRDRALYAIDSLSGKALWSQSIRKLDPERRSKGLRGILATEQRVFVVGPSVIQSRNAADGKIEWEHTGDYWWHPVLYDGALYVPHTPDGMEMRWPSWMPRPESRRDGKECLGPREGA